MVKTVSGDKVLRYKSTYMNTPVRKQKTYSYQCFVVIRSRRYTAVFITLLSIEPDVNVLV